MTHLKFHTMNHPVFKLLGILVVASLLLTGCLPTQDTSAPTETPASATSAPGAASAYPANPTSSAATAYPSASNSASTAYPPASSSAAQDVVVNIGQSTALGNFLVDGAGMTLYAYSKDSAGTSTCSAACLANWPPLLASSPVTAFAGLDATLFSTAQTTDGRTMVTYKGAPLYQYTGDKIPGDTNGNNVANVWSVVKP